MRQNIKLNGVDEFLGAREDRYFSYGYKGVSFAYNKMEYTNNAFNCNLNLSWKLPFGKKEGKVLSVHLGTVEYFNISCVAADLLLGAIYKMSDSDRNRSWVSGFDIKTSACNKNEYSNILVSAEVLKSDSLQNEAEEVQTKIKVVVGEMAMYLFVNHPAMEQNEDIASKISLENFRKQIEEGYYTKGYKDADLDITNLNVELGKGTIDANVELKYSEQDGSWLGKDYYPGLSISDFVLSTGQLTQVLLYLQEGLYRSQTNNLWLREMYVRCDRPCSGTCTHEEVTFSEHKCVKFNGDNWSMVSLNATLGSIKATIKVAHMLPKVDFVN